LKLTIRQIAARGLNKTLIFEDDVNFMPNFRLNLARSMADVDELLFDWDLL
jgi:GR25 family glycosyltransferase involved in LPS biosynthesis